MKEVVDLPEYLVGCRTVYWTSEGLRLEKCVLTSRLRHTWWYVNYAYGYIHGERVKIDLPFTRLPKGGWQATILKHARDAKIYAKGLGILSNCEFINL